MCLATNQPTLTTVPKQLARQGQTAKSATPSPWRDLAAAVSLANLCFFGFWHTFLFSTPLLAPMWTWRDLFAIALNVSALAAGFWVLLRLGSRSARFPGWHRGLYLLAPLILLRLLELRYYRLLRRLWIAVEDDPLRILLAAAAVLLAGYAAVRGRRRFLTAAEVLTLCLFAFVPVSFLQGAWVIYGDRAGTSEGPMASAPLLPVRAGQPRVVWIVFDEMDWRYVFPRRPASLQMPEMDRLRAQSIYAESAFQPGLETSESMMSYFYGRQVYSLEPTGKASFRLLFLDEPRKMDGPGPPHLFSLARQAGFNTAMVGWFLPYCRLFQQSLNRCYWESMETRVRGLQPDLATSFRSQLRSLSPLEARQRHVERYLAMLEEARRAVADPKLGLVVLHLAVPHEPAIYRRDRAELTLFNFHSDWYFDNLALADRTLGVLRREMEQAGLWDASTVLVTSDHSLRWYAMLDETVDPRVPFLVKLEGEQQEVIYHAPLRSLVAHDLTLALLRGELSQPGEVTHWFDQRVLPVPPGAPAAGLSGAGSEPHPAGSRP
ncbi:MAG: sulfatase-like hydrolase/transferase, partial [Acidobacteriota bacterium]|nr:sulfatase-like hydrolase/transferase [Acidobacteriota bacterium]